jgi:hypothetical protein
MTRRTAIHAIITNDAITTAGSYNVTSRVLASARKRWESLTQPEQDAKVQAHMEREAKMRDLAGWR